MWDFFFFFFLRFYTSASLFALIRKMKISDFLFFWCQVIFLANGKCFEINPSMRRSIQLVPSLWCLNQAHPIDRPWKELVSNLLKTTKATLFIKMTLFSGKHRLIFTLEVSILPLKWKVKAVTMTGTAVKRSKNETSPVKSGSHLGFFVVPLNSA